MLASLLYPYDDDAPSLIDGWLGQLEHEGCILRYESNGDQYIQICNWLIHQKIDKPSKSKIPSPQESSRILANPREHSSEDQGPRTKDQGIKDHVSGASRANGNWNFEGKIPATLPDESALMDAFATIRTLYPKRSGRDTWAMAERPWRVLVDSGVPIAALLAGVERYAKFCAAGGVSGPAFVLDPVKFFGASDNPWCQAWDPPPTKAETKRDANIDASLKWLENSNAGT